MKISGTKLAKALNLGALFGYAASTFLIAGSSILAGAAAMGAATVMACGARTVMKKEKQKNSAEG